MPIPELVVVESVADLTSAFADGDRSGQVIGDDERTSYGLLLDRAAERGLLTPAEYQIRLRALAEATTVETMHEIVTELPVLGRPAARAPKRARSTRRAVPPGAAVPSGHAAVAPGTPPRRSSPWFVLVVVVLVVVLSMVFFAVYAEHLVRAHGSAAGVGHLVALAVSDLRS
jgi:hypothetical protein